MRPGEERYRLATGKRLRGEERNRRASSKGVLSGTAPEPVSDRSLIKASLAASVAGVFVGILALFKRER